MSYVNLIVFVLDPASRLPFENIPFFQTYPSIRSSNSTGKGNMKKKDENAELKQAFFCISTAWDPIITFQC